MPPKQAPKRLTKKEKRELALKLKQEEEERRRQEEEEERLKREEEERKRKIEEERLAKEEEQRLLKENQDNQDWVSAMKKARVAAEQESKVQEEWFKFILSHSIADPEREAQITTFITQYKELPPVSNLQIQETLNYMQKSEELVEEIESFYLKYNSVGDYQKSQKYFNFIKEIREITDQKLEECTCDLIRNSEKLADQKEEEVKKQQEEQTQGKAGKIDSKMFEVHQIYQLLNDFRYGLWINPNQKGGFRHKPIDFKETKMQMENPQKLLHQAFIMKACWMSYDNFSNPNKYYKHRIVGGVTNIECLERPPLQTKGGNWFLKYNFDVKDSLKRLSNGTEGQGAQPVRIWYQLPDYLKLYKGKKPQIAVFDDNTEEWRKDLVSDISEISEDKVINFRTPKIGPCGLIQDRCTDYPYQKFFMRAVDDNKILIDIMGNRDTFKFEIGPGYAMLIPNPEIPEFDNFQGKKLPVGKLLNLLAKSGVNLLPVREDAITATLTPKNAVTEDLAIKDVCQAIRSFMIRSSPFSFQLSEDKILCRFRENEEYDDQTFGEDQEKDWKSICWYPNKCAILRCGDNEEVPDERFKENTVAHINLEYLLKGHELTPDWALKRMKDTEFVLTQDTLAQFLQLTHILTFTVFESEKKFDDEEEEELENKNQQQDGDDSHIQQEGENQQNEGDQLNNEQQQQQQQEEGENKNDDQKQGENNEQQEQQQQ